MNNLPTKVNFDICTFCNHKCNFCSNGDKRTLKNQVSLSDFNKVMTNITKHLEIEELGLSAKGEVLINKDLSKIIELCKNTYKIPYVYISSNGSLLTKENTYDLLEAGLDSIKLSINGISNSEYRTTHQKDDFEKVINNLKYLLQLKKDKFPKLKVLISSIIDKQKKEIDTAFKDLLEENYELIDNTFKYNITYTPKFENFSVDNSKLKPCPLALEEVYIDSDCRLGLCCKDYFKEFDYGSLLNYDFLELYNSKPMKNLRKMHLNKSFPDNHFCRKCLIFNEEVNDDK
ncbi:MAG: radical SAM/SPASM domain-containing protein [Campylobacterota bacterium]